jgi:hypothetical protein
MSFALNEPREASAVRARFSALCLAWTLGLASCTPTSTTEDDGLTEQTLVLDAGTVVVRPSSYSIPPGCSDEWIVLVDSVFALQRCSRDSDCVQLPVPEGAPTGLSGEFCCQLPLAPGKEDEYQEALSAYYASGCRPRGQACAECLITGPTCIEGSCQFDP